MTNITNKIIILSYATHKCPAYNIFKQSITNNNYEYLIVGLDTKWNGFINRLIYYRDGMDTYDDDTIFCILDCYDVMCCSNIINFTNKLRSYDINNKIIFSSETYCGSNCTPIDNWWKQQSVSPHQYFKNIYINGGMYVGTKKNISHMFDYVIQPVNTDDQVEFGHYVNKYPHKVDLDLKCELFGNILQQDVYKYTYKNNKVYNKVYNTYPCFIHCPGGKSDAHLRYTYYVYKLIGINYATHMYIYTIKKNKLYFMVLLIIFLVCFFLKPIILLLLIIILLIYIWLLVF